MEVGLVKMSESECDRVRKSESTVSVIGIKDDTSKSENGRE